MTSLFKVNSLKRLGGGFTVALQELKVNRKKAFSLLIITALLLSTFIVLVKVPTAKAAIVWNDDFSSNSLASYTLANETTALEPKIASTLSFDGDNYSLNLTTSGNQHPASITPTGGFTETNPAWLSFAYYCDNLPSTNENYINIATFGSSDYGLMQVSLKMIYQNDGLQLQVSTRDDGTYAYSYFNTSNLALSNNEWCWITLNLYGASTNGYVNATVYDAEGSVLGNVYNGSLNSALEAPSVFSLIVTVSNYGEANSYYDDVQVSGEEPNFPLDIPVPVPTITYPANTTYYIHSVPINVSVTGGVNPSWTGNVWNGSYIYASNLTSANNSVYLSNGNYRFDVWTTNNEGGVSSGNVSFTVNVPVANMSAIIFYDRFDDGLGNWTTYGGYPMANTTTAYAYNGNNSLEVSVNVDNYGSTVTAHEEGGTSGGTFLNTVHHVFVGMEIYANTTHSDAGNPLNMMQCLFQIRNNTGTLMGSAAVNSSDGENYYFGLQWYNSTLHDGSGLFNASNTIFVPKIPYWVVIEYNFDSTHTWLSMYINNNPIPILTLTIDQPEDYNAYILDSLLIGPHASAGGMGMDAPVWVDNAVVSSSYTSDPFELEYEAEDSYVAVASWVSPENTTYTSSTVNYEVSNTGNETGVAWQINAYLNGVPVGANKTSATGSFTGLTNGTYTFAAYGIGDNGASDYEEIIFTVAIPEDTYFITVTPITPANTTYLTSSIPINITTTTNGTNPITTWNIQFSNGTWLYAENQTFTVATTATINENLTATFHTWANNTEGSTDTATVTFTVLLEEEPEPTPTPTPTTPTTESTIDVLMFVFPLIFAFIFSILTFHSRSDALKRQDPANYAGIFYAAFAMVLWWLSGIIWPAIATSAMFVPIAYLWFGVGFIFLAVLVAFVFLVLKAAIETKGESKLVIREVHSEYD
jgi:hypothetical protein